jgi:hypothetical protein
MSHDSEAADVNILDDDEPEEKELDDEKEVECLICSEHVHPETCYTETVFWSPHDKTGEEAHICDQNNNRCFDEFVTGDGCGEFGFRACRACGRWICKRNPANGYQTWFRSPPDNFEADEAADEEDDDDGYAYGPEICCGCYQEHVLKRGQPLSDFQVSFFFG